MIKVVIFDLSGVIWKRRSFNQEFFLLLSQTLTLHTKTTRAKYKLVCSQFQTGKLELDNWLKTFHLDQSRISQFNQKLESLFKSHYQKDFHPKSISLLRLLKNNDITVGCLTNSENFLIKLLSKAGFFCYFDFKITSAKLGYRKPNQKIYKKIFKIGNWKPEEIIFIDNQKSNIEIANKLGIYSIKFKSYKLLASKLDSLIFQKD